MKTFSLFIFGIFISILAKAQVGINNTNPKASLDISATNQANPLNTDGLLIPRIDTFPTTNPTINQQGMLVYLTTISGSNDPGYYYWDNTTSIWKAALGTDGDGWYEEGTTTIPNNINDNIFTNGFVGIGDNTPDSKLDVEYTGANSSGATITYNYTGNINPPAGLSVKSETSGTGTNNRIFGAYIQTRNSNSSTYSTAVYGFSSANASYNAGLSGNASGNGTRNVGVNGLASGASGNNIGGIFNIISNTSFVNYGIIASAKGGSTTNWAGYFGNYIGGATAGSGNVFIQDLLQVDGALKFTNGATNNYILKTDASGNATWVNPTTVFTDTDNQQIDQLSLSGTTLEISLQDDGIAPVSVDLSSLQDGGALKINDLLDGKSDNDGSQDGSSIFLGINAGLNDDITNNKNVGIGFESLKFNTSGTNNSAIGYKSLSLNTTGDCNTAFGWRSLSLNTIGENNTGLGFGALSNNTTGTSNTAIGRSTLQSNDTGYNNSALGYASLSQNIDGFQNTAIGFSTLYYNISGSKNTALGYQSLSSNTVGLNNTAVGYQAGLNSTLGSGNIFLGYLSGLSETGSNKLYIENSSANANNALIYGEFDTNILRTNSQFQIGNPTGTGYAFPTIDGTINQILLTDGNGALSWVNPTTIFTDNQNITGSGLSGTNLTIGIENGTNETINLASLRDADWLEAGGTPPNSINDNIYTYGNVGIGTTAISNASLHISRNGSSTYPQLDLTETQANDGTRINFTNSVETTNKWILYARADNTSTNNYFNVYNTVGGNIITVKGEGKVGINRTPTTNSFEVNGTASKTTAGNWLANSDRRLKKNIVNISGKDALEKISKMKGVTYLWNDDKTGINRPKNIQYGFIAQDLMQVFPSKVSMDNLGYYQTAYGDYDPIFVEAIKQLKSEVDALSKENQQLKATLKKYEDLATRLTALENHSNP